VGSAPVTTFGATGARFVNSYDPRQWARTWSPERAQEVSAQRQADVKRRLIAVGIGSGIVLAGAMVAWLGGNLGNPAPKTAPTQAASGAASQAVPAKPGEVRRTLQLASPDELPSALQSLGLSADLAQKVAAEAQPALVAGGQIRAVLVMTRGKGELTFSRLEASNPDSSGAIVRAGADGVLQTSRIAAQVQEHITVMHGIMDGDSFYTSAVAIGVPNSLISPFAKALSFDFDFQREVSAGDAFELAYSQKVNAQGEAMGAPELLYASLTTQTKSASVYRFTPAGGKEGWYDASGRTVARGFMATPIDGARITSKFGMRFHPTLHYTRMHQGVDFAAPIGTPIYAAAAGTVLTASPNKCGGNWVIINHANGFQTRYFHLSRYAEGMHEGLHVEQGETIGYVGVTGTCTTGPHLHYETLINGEHVDPLSILNMDSGAERKVLTGDDLRRFEEVRDRVDVSRARDSS